MTQTTQLLISTTIHTILIVTSICMMRIVYSVGVQLYKTAEKPKTALASAMLAMLVFGMVVYFALFGGNISTHPVPKVEGHPLTPAVYHTAPEQELAVWL